MKELDLVEEEDRITHEIDLNSKELKEQNELNYFRFNPKFEEEEKEWDAFKLEVLGDEIDNVLEKPEIEVEESKIEDVKPQTIIGDETAQDLSNLRKTIYLIVTSSVEFEACCHKLMKLTL